jgi:hypothetical protein
MKRRVLLALALAVACPGTVVWAAPRAIGSPFPVSTCGDCTKELPQVAGTPSGAFLVVWDVATGAQGSTETVPGRLFAASGAPSADEFPVDRRAVSGQTDGAVAADPQGSYVVVWSSSADGQSDVFAQRYTPRGRAVGPVILVSLDDPAAAVPPNDVLPAVAKSADGGFAIAWVSVVPAGNFSNGEPPRVLSRRFSPAGLPLGPPVQVNEGLFSGDRPDICIDTAGRPVVAWTSVDEYRPFQASFQGASVRRLSPAGALSGAEIPVAAPDNDNVSATVACGPGSTFTVVWQGDQGPLAVHEGEIFAQRFTRLARRNGPVFRVNSVTVGDQSHPRAAYDPTGALVVVWESRAINGTEGVFARRFLASGAATGDDLAVDALLDDTISPEPAVAPLGNVGAFLVVWRDGLTHLWGQRFTP